MRAGTQQRAAVRRSGRICLLGLVAALPHVFSLVDSETTEHESEPQGRERLHCVLRESQSHEDIVLLPLLLEAAATRGSKQTLRGPGGTFTEIGAFDGFNGSQTYLLERCFGWRGALIEASPQNFAQLNATHRNKHSVKVHAAACNGTGTITVAGGGGTVAGVVSDFSHGFAKKWSKAHTKDCGGMSCTSEVPCRPLPTIVAEVGFPHVNFLSLDVEGSEERVLQTVAWVHGFAPESFPFDVVMVEADHHNRGKNERVKKMLLKWGLLQRPIAQSMGSYNELYIHPDIKDVRPDVTAIRKRWRVPAVNQKLKDMLSKAAASHKMSLRLQHTDKNLIIERLTQGLPREMELLIQEMEKSTSAA